MRDCNEALSHTAGDSLEADRDIYLGKVRRQSSQSIGKTVGCARPSPELAFLLIDEIVETGEQVGGGPVKRLAEASSVEIKDGIRNR